MKRDMDVIRHILLKVEALTPGNVPVSELTTPDWDEPVIAYHVELLTEAGLLDARIIRTMGRQIGRFHINRLTWDGSEFLDAIRDDTIWNTTKKRVAATAGTVTIEVLKAVAVSIAKSTLGLSPG